MSQEIADRTQGKRERENCIVKWSSSIRTHANPQFLNTFTAARQGNEKTQRILLRYDRLIHAKRKKHEMESRILRELVGFFFSTSSNMRQMFN